MNDEIIEVATGVSPARLRRRRTKWLCRHTVTGLGLLALAAPCLIAQPQQQQQQQQQRQQAQAQGEQQESQNPMTINWTAITLEGKQARVPASNQPTLLVYVMAGQDRSMEALKQVMALAGENPAAQLLAVVSGASTQVKARSILDKTKWPWPIVLDPSYAAANSAAVRAWPTTVVVRKDGKVAARIAGMSGAYATDIKAYLEFAQGRMNRPQLDQRLGDHQVVADSAAQAAERHLRVAQRLIERREFENAREQVAEGLKYQPQDPTLQLLHARILALLGQASQSMKILDKLPPKRLAGWQVGVVRGRALMGLGKWDDAKAILLTSLKLNPEPAEAQYLLGQIYARAGDWPRAATSFRAAFEATHEGMVLSQTP